MRGLELGYSQQFISCRVSGKVWAPYANVTRMLAEGNMGGHRDSARTEPARRGLHIPSSPNAGISYLGHPGSIRVSYNYRGRYLTGFNVNESRATYAHARPVVDIKTLYNINRYYSVYLDVVNLLMQPDRQIEFGYGRPQTTHLMRPQFFFGVNGRM